MLKVPRLVLLCLLTVCLTACNDDERDEKSADRPAADTTQSDAAGRSGAGADDPATEAVAPESWSAYLPGEIGDGCVLAIDPIKVGTARITSEAAQKVVSIAEVGEGKEYQLETTTTVTTDDTDPLPGDPEHDVDSTSETYTYVAKGDGTMSFSSGRYVSEGFPVDVDTIGVLFPTLEQARAGEAVDIRAEMTISAPDEASAAEFRTMTTDGSAQLALSMAFHISGVPTAAVQTPAGTFSDVVGVRLEVTGADFTNATPESAEQFKDVADALAPRTTTWFARGTGIVQVSSLGGLAAGVIKASRCTGAEGATAPGEAVDGPNVEAAQDRVVNVPDSADGAAFTTPSGNITCAITGGDAGPEARCDIYEYSYTPPPQTTDCVTNYGNSVQLAATAIMLCAGDSIQSLADVTYSSGVSDYTTWFDPAIDELVTAANDPTSDPHQAALPYGSTITYAGISCTSAETGVTCTNQSTGASFLISRAVLRLSP